MKMNDDLFSRTREIVNPDVFCGKKVVVVGVGSGGAKWALSLAMSGVGCCRRCTTSPPAGITASSTTMEMGKPTFLAKGPAIRRKKAKLHGGINDGNGRYFNAGARFGWLPQRGGSSAPMLGRSPAGATRR